MEKRRAPDRGRDPVTQGNRRRVAAGVERPPLYPLRRCTGCPAQRGCARGGLDDRFPRDHSRLSLHRAGVSPEAVQIADPLRLPFPRRRPLNAKTDARKIERG
jgi:hypothetical protein